MLYITLSIFLFFSQKPKLLNNQIPFISLMGYVLFFGEAEEKDFDKIGIKGVNLAKLFKNNFKVPPGFILSKNVLDFFLSRKEIKPLINEIVRCSKEELHEKAHHLQKTIKTLEFSEEIADEIIEAYLSLSVDIERMTAASLLETEEVFVAVRSSYLDEKGDIPELSQKTILNVKGNERLFKAILECYAANFTPENISYKKENNESEISSAVIIQRMIESEKSGVAYSINQESGNEHEIIIKACFGLGEGISSGNVFPDSYIVDKNTAAIKETKIAEKQFEYIRDIDTDSTVKHELGDMSKKQVLLDEEIFQIAHTLKKIVHSFGSEQKIEWAIKRNTLYVLQTKEIENHKKEERTTETVEMEVYDKEEEPVKIIDINDNDELEEDLLALEEIERQEKETGKLKAEENEKMEFTEITPEDVMIIDTGEKADEKVIEEKIQDEKKEEDSIFIGYKSFEPSDTNEEKEPKQINVEKLMELAMLNSGNTLVYCHMVIKEKLSQRLKRYAKVIPHTFIDILNELIEYETTGVEDNLRKIDKLKNDFITRLRYPLPEEVEMALRLMNEV